MNAVFPAKQAPAPTSSFTHEIIGDSMAPTYEPGRHAVICVPVEGYLCEGVYLVNGIDLYRCQREGGFVRMMRDNKFYSDRIHPLEDFNGADLALVCADVKITNPSVLRQAQLAA
jgi:hypothetical protein